MNEALSPQYDPQAVESRIYALWLEKTGNFHAVPGAAGSPKFSMVIPPPNVTGALHLGHAINGTIQDILARYHRMKGDNTLWIPGIDHAGIATQAVVERTIFEQEKKSRHDLGREELVRRIWQWKEKFGNRIIQQLQRMGVSCDWNRTRFTLDDICARAVREAFFKLFKDGLIFRGLRLVNWDTHLQTAVADDEIYHETVKGRLTSIKYPLVDRRPGEPEYLIVATTRPETMLGDTALAVHPEDPRYQKLIGRKAQVPLMGREIPIIADGLLVDPKFGTGVVKVTPAHDPNDYAAGQRNHLPQINLLTPDGKVNGNGTGKSGFWGKSFDYSGLRFASDARRLVLEDLEVLGLIAESKPYEHEVGHSDRSKTPIEPYLSEQWFVKMGDVEGGITLGDGTKSSGLAQAALDAVKSGRVKIIPARYTQGYIDWLSQKRDWCISRQLWWGHRIPVWSVSCNPGIDFGHPTREEATQEIANKIVAYISDEKHSNDLIFRVDTTYGLPKIVFCCRTTEVAEKMEELAGYINANATDTIHSPPLEKESDLRLAPKGLRELIRNNGLTLAIRRLMQDPDVLDTWFSSALWPLSTMGWPANGISDKPEDQLLPYFYPTGVLSTAREILTLWVARMVMFGLYLHGDVPFKQVYIHAVIQDGQGRPMKKSLGNGVDPVDIIESHGADALRFTLAGMATETQDIRLPVVKDKATGKNTSPRFDSGRNFANKIWNAARFILSNLDESHRKHEISNFNSPIIAIAQSGKLEDRWILSRLNQTVRATYESLAQFRFADLCSTLYGFFWNDLCDWYLEIAKARLQQKDSSVPTVLHYCLQTSLALLHPVMPFITEEIFTRLAPTAESLLLAGPFPEYIRELDCPRAEKEMDLLQRIIRAIRDIRNQCNIESKKILDAAVLVSAHDRAIVVENRTIIETLSGATLREIKETGHRLSDIFQKDTVRVILPCLPGHRQTDVQIHVSGAADRPAQIKKLAQRRLELEKLIAAGKARMANDGFISKAPPAVVQGLREQLCKQESELTAIQQRLTELTGA